MTYRNLERLLGTEPGVLAAIFDEGIANHYSRVRRGPAGQPHRGKRTKTKARDIIAPNHRLKLVQRKIANLLTSRFLPHPISHGYTKDRSIASNARVHVGARLILTVDLTNFFGSISQNAVLKALEKILWECSEFELLLITDLCCFDSLLPNGSPASPVISNIVCRQLDIQLSEFAAALDCRISRYSDDIFISTAAASFPVQLVEEWAYGGFQEIELGRRLPSLIQAHGFEINWNKVRVQSQPGRMQVTGVSIGASDISVPRDFRDNVRACIHQW